MTTDRRAPPVGAPPHEYKTGFTAAINTDLPVGTVPRDPGPLVVIDHPHYYGGADNPYEAIKVIEAWELNFNLGTALKYIARDGKKSEGERLAIADLKKARWYLDREITNREKELGI